MSGFTVRLPFEALPAEVRRALERALASPIVGSTDVHGGMSAGPAAVLELTDGRRVFAKVTSRDINERSHQLYVDEVEAYRALELVPGLPMPRLLSTFVHGPWIGLILTVAAGTTPGPPWQTGAVASVADALAVVASHRAPPSIPPAIGRLPQLDGWAVMSTDPPGPLDEWDRQRAAHCSSLADGWREWTAGTALSHNDCRCDNALVDHRGHVTLVDWNFACAGAPWLDLAMLAADVVASGLGPTTVPPTRAGRRDAESTAVQMACSILVGLPEDASRFVVALAGMLRRNSMLPPHQGLPTFRVWQARRADRLRPLVDALLGGLGS